MVLRNTRPPGRPGFIWATRAGFYGFWGSGTCAPWFTPGITVFSPTWCPFNNRIAYVEWVGPARRILVYDSVWGTPRPFLGNDWDYADQLSWSPDGRYLAFVGRRFGEEGLFLLDTVTGTTQRIANGFDRCVSPVWHPRGNGLFFLGSRFGSRRVYRIDPWSGFATPCDNIPFGDIQRILVTPDGGGLVLGMAGGAGWTEIWDVDLSGRSMSRPLMRLQGPFEQPTFSPDGRRIHFTQSEGDAVRLLSIDRSGSDLRVHGDPLR